MYDTDAVVKTEIETVGGKRRFLRDLVLEDEV
jgi:hypothetical protein